MSLHNPISPLHAYYVQKVLPAVYDDSLSYYEILCKVQETLNEVVSTTNEQSVVVLEMQQAIYDFIHGGYTDTFEEYLDEWFEENSDAFVQRLIDEGIIPEVADIQNDLESVHGDIAELVASDTSIRNDMVAADTELTTKKVPYPLVDATPSYGTIGQVLSTNSDGTTEWQDPVIPSDAQAEQVITQWLNDHPEATTTVQDGAITTAKLTNGCVTDAKLAQSGGVLEKVNDLESTFTKLLQFDEVRYNTTYGHAHSAEKIIDVDISAGSTFYIVISFTGDSVSTVAPMFYYSDETSSAQSSVVANGTYTYVASKDIVGIGFYSGASLPTGKVTAYIYLYDSVANSDVAIAALNGVLETAQNQIEINTGDISDLKDALGTVPSGKTAQGQITDNTNDIVALKNSTTKLLQFDEVRYNTTYGHAHSAEKIIDVDISTGSTFYINISFTGDSVSTVSPMFYYSDETSSAQSSVVANGTYTYVASKDIVGIGFYSGASLPTGKVTAYIYLYDSVANSDVAIAALSSRIDAIPSGSGLLAVVAPAGASANSFDKNMTWYSFGTSNTPSNLPTGVQVGNLVNLRGNSVTDRSAQILFDNVSNTLYYRTKSNGIWSNWKGESNNTITIKKTASSQFSVYVPNENGHIVRYDYTHIAKKWDSLTYTDGNGQSQTALNVISCDMWNNYYVYDNDNNAYIAQGHSNFIVNINDDVDKYCGDGHGNEVIISYDVIADGVEIDILNMATNTAVTCSSLRLVQRSNVYRVGGADSSNNYQDSYPLLDTNGNPVVALFHYMEILYELGNTVTINNKIVVKQDNIVFNECHGAMLECPFTGFNKVMCNNGENTMNEVDEDGVFTVATGSSKNLANTAQKCNIVEMYGDSFYIRQTMTNDVLSNDTTNVVYFNKYPNRLKCYFQPVKTVNRALSGVTPDTFNSGDVISVTDERRISI